MVGFSDHWLGLFGCFSAVQEVREYLDYAFAMPVRAWEQSVPGSLRHLILQLAFPSQPPETQNVNPQTDFKVFMDLQLNVIANDPAFAGLYGLVWPYSEYAGSDIGSISITCETQTSTRALRSLRVGGFSVRCLITSSLGSARSATGWWISGVAPRPGRFGPPNKTAWQRAPLPAIVGSRADTRPRRAATRSSG